MDLKSLKEIIVALESAQKENFTLARTHGVLAGLCVAVIAQITSANALTEPLRTAVFFFGFGTLLNAFCYFCEVCPGMPRVRNSAIVAIVILMHICSVSSTLAGMALVMWHFSVTAGIIFAGLGSFLLFFTTYLANNPRREIRKIMKSIDSEVVEIVKIQDDVRKRLDNSKYIVNSVTKEINDLEAKESLTEDDRNNIKKLKHLLSNQMEIADVNAEENKKVGDRLDKCHAHRLRLENLMKVQFPLFPRIITD